MKTKKKKEHILTIESLQKRLCCFIFGLFFAILFTFLTIKFYSDFFGEGEGCIYYFGATIILIIFLAIALIGYGLAFIAWSKDFDENAKSLRV